MSGPRSRDLETLVIKYISLMVCPQQPFLRMFANFVSSYTYTHVCAHTCAHAHLQESCWTNQTASFNPNSSYLAHPQFFHSYISDHRFLIFFPLIYTQVMDQAIQKLYARIRTLNNRLLSCHHVILERRAHTTERQNPRDIINEAGSDLLLLWTMMDSISRCVCVRVYVWGGGYVSVFALVRVSVHTYMGVSNLLHTHT